MLARIRDWHQNLSWNVGHRQGREKRPFKCPWWVDREMCGLAYLQAKGADFTEAAAWAKQDADQIKDLVGRLRSTHSKE